MADSCEHLEYREAGDGTQFDHERPFCAVVGEFVQPMRADVCAMRYDLEPAEDCEYYRDGHDLGSVTGFEGEAHRTGASDEGEAHRTDPTDEDGAGAESDDGDDA